VTAAGKNSQKGYKVIPDRFGLSLQALSLLFLISENKLSLNELLPLEGERKKARRHLADLKQAFGQEFYVKYAKPTALSPVGHELIKISSEFLTAVADFRRKCKGLPPLISIGAGDSMLNWVALPALNRLAKNEPVQFSVIQGGTKGLIRLLSSSQIDFAVLSADTPLNSRWKSLEIGTYEYGVCFSKSLFSEKFVDKHVCGLDFALIRQHWGLDFVGEAANQNIQLNRKVLCETFTHVASLVKSGAFAGILPLSTGSSFPADSFIWGQPKFLNKMRRVIKLVWDGRRRHENKMVEALAEPLLEVLQTTLNSKQNETNQRLQYE
jgi:DNA-binding transcriptional LysR family regulator